MPGWAMYPYDGGGVLVNPHADNVVMLNACAAEVWAGRQDGLGPDQIAARLSQRFTVSQTQAREDVLAQLHALAQLPVAPGLDPVDVAAGSDHVSGCIAHGASREKSASRELCAVYQVGPTLVEVEYACAELKANVHPVFAHLACDGSVPAAVRLVSVLRAGSYCLQGVAAVEHDQDVGRFAAALIRQILVSAIEASNPAMVIHGAAVARGDQCVIFPGLSGSGKSTLAAALASSGFTLLADDVLLVERESFGIRGIPARMNLKAGSLPVLARDYGLGEGVHELSVSGRKVHYLLPPAYDARALEQAYQPVAAVFPRYCEGAATADLVPVGASELLSGLLESQSTIAPDARSAQVHGVLQWLESLPAYGMTYNSLAQAVATVETIFERNSR